MPFAPCALPFALTLPPDEHAGLEFFGVCVGDGSQDVTEGGVTDVPGFLHCEQPGEKDVGPSGGPGCHCLVAGGIGSPHCFRKLEDVFSSRPSCYVLLGLAEQWAACSVCQTRKRPLPVLGVFEPKSVAITQAHKLVQDDSTEEGAVNFQHASREQLQPRCVVGIQSSNLLQDLARNPHRTAHVSRGNSAGPQKVLASLRRREECACPRHHTSMGWEDAQAHAALSSRHGLEQLSTTPRASQLQEEQSSQRHRRLALGQDIFIRAM